MWNLIPRKRMPPTQLVRYCCQILKEQSTPNRIIAVGVRASESSGRKGRDIFAVRGNTKKDGLFFSLEHSQEVFEESKELDEIWDCKLIESARKNNDIIVNPIYEWDDSDIWDYIRKNEIEVNPLYQKGYKRVGCIGCPMAGYFQRQKEFSDFPKYKDAYIRAFDRMIEGRKRYGLPTKWETGQEVFDWWIQKYKHECKGQMSFEDLEKGEKK